MGRGDRRKCKCCLKLFRPDARNRRHQFYCSASGCRAASKAASQARWLAKPENEGYFRGPVNVARVQAWRARHPGCREGSSCRRCVTRCLNGAAHWFHCRNSHCGAFAVTRCLNGATCCSDWLIAHLVGMPLQDAMPHAALHLLCRTGNYAASSGRCARNPAMHTARQHLMRHSSAEYRCLRN